jgi:nickel-dependent lactate racemase
MIFNLAYGKTGHIIELPDDFNVDLIEPRWIDSVYDQQLAISDALKNPYKNKPLNEKVTASDKVGIIFSDITRATPYRTILPPLLNELRNIPQENISLFCANGTHRHVTDEELVGILGEKIIGNFKIQQNDANNPDNFEYVGTTRSGNEIFLNKEILKCDIKILTGFIEPHFFAGFSGGGKALIPGLAFVKSIKYNHSLRQLSHENVNWGITYGNPLWEEIMEAAEFVPGLFLLNITLNKNKDITNVFAGDLRSAHMAGCKFVKDSAMVPVDKLYDIVITSNSGFPLDLNVYQAVKGMSAAAQIVKPGGTIIIAAECRDGIPSNSDYETILKSVGTVDELMGFIVKNEDQLKDTWQIFFQVKIQQKADVYLFSTKLDNETIRKALFNPVEDIASLTGELVRKIGSQASICILPEGPQTIPCLNNI